MNDLKIFENTQFGTVRTIIRDGEPWFVAADVCAALEISNTTQAIERLDEDEKSMLNIGLQGGATNCINEPGLYTLVLGSRKPEAKAFKRWITHEVIPSIRRHGGYLTPEKVQEAILNPDTLIQLATALKQEREARSLAEAENTRLSVQNQAMLPKAEYFDALADRGLLTSFRETAKELGIKERCFVSFLIEHKYIFRDKKGKLQPCSGRGDGLFELKESINDKTGWAGTQTLITVKGREHFRILMQGMAE